MSIKLQGRGSADSLRSFQIPVVRWRAGQYLFIGTSVIMTASLLVNYRAGPVVPVPLDSPKEFHVVRVGKSIGVLYPSVSPALQLFRQEFVGDLFHPDVPALGACGDFLHLVHER